MIIKRDSRISLDGDWRLAYGEHGLFDCELTCVWDVTAAGLPVIAAVVPGNFELDLERAGVIGEIYYGTNILDIQKYENYHMYYFCEFDYAPDGKYSDVLFFEGLDCFAEVFVDGVKIGGCNNMLVEQVFEIPKSLLTSGKHELFVHITPAVVAARDIDLPPYVHAMRYSWDSLYVRKAPHMYGWDIMPRAVSGGIWKHVYIDRRPVNRIDDVFMYTNSVSENGGDAVVTFVYNAKILTGDIRRYKIRIFAHCVDKAFEVYTKMWHTSGDFRVTVHDAQLWYPRNYGAASLYNVTAELYFDDEIVDSVKFESGIRIVQLNRTSTTDADGNGEFCFVVNGKKIFAMGTNWVPVDAFHSRDEERLPEILPMLDDIGCNIVRCWGGNVYENDLFYEYCDKNGIMVWQDFAMACAVYPQDAPFCKMLEDEVTSVVKRLRNHPCIALWAGDNECDQAYSWNFSGYAGTNDPNKNVLTRKVIPGVLRNHDFTRPYLPSSPYIDEYAYSSGTAISEDHLWGSREYFKSDYYMNAVCHFASEMGYHACASPESLAKYIPEESLWAYSGSIVDDPNWIAHCASPEIEKGVSPYYYRIGLMYRQVRTMFGDIPGNLNEFALASQISQAEAKKYFIERFRISKWRRTGIIWWNLIDGWPQISDAVVDYYLDKKVAYDYIKRSQTDFCMMFDEPRDGYLQLFAANDTESEKAVKFSVKDDANNVIFSGEFTVSAHVSLPIERIPAPSDVGKFYFIEWDDGEKAGENHYVANIKGVNFGYYKEQLAKIRK
jgi:Beta-galactosidase/beta-glucuronidase